MRLPSLRVIAAVELLGGAYCVIAGLYMGGSLGLVQGWLFTVVLGGGGVLAGYWLWRGDARGVRLSILVQALALVQLVVPRAGFVALFGPSIVMGFRGTSSFAFRVAMEPELYLAVGHHSDPFRLEFNLLALAFVLTLWRARASIAAPARESASDAPAV